MPAHCVLLEKRGPTALLTLNRPEHHNALTSAMMDQLAAAWLEIKADDCIVCAIVTGAGNAAFCTGMDLTELAALGEQLPPLPEGWQQSSVCRLTALQNHCWKPVITAINGMVCGGGFQFIADSDLVIAADTATFFDRHVAAGLVAGLEFAGLARRIPLETVLRLALLDGSERMTAQEALECRLVGEVLPAERLLDRAFELAERISRCSPTALMRTKRAIWQGLDQGLHGALDVAWRHIREHQAHPDPIEGARAWTGRRAPVWAPVPDDIKR